MFKKYLLNKSILQMALIYSIINNKGGTGKTTTTLNLASALIKKKKKVLMVDFDAQCNLTSSLSITAHNHNIGDFLLDKSSFADTVVTLNKHDIIPGSEKLQDFEYQANNEPGREYLLKEALEGIKNNYDYILVDCAPNLGILSMNSLVAADYYIVPMQAENFAFIGLDKILHIANKVKKRLNPNLKLSGILIVRLSHKTRFSQAVISNLKLNENIKDKVFRTFIRQDINLMESAAFGQPVFEYAPKSRGAEDYMNFAKEILKQNGH